MAGQNAADAIRAVYGTLGGGGTAVRVFAWNGDVRLGSR